MLQELEGEGFIYLAQSKNGTKEPTPYAPLGIQRNDDEENILQ